MTVKPTYEELEKKIEELKKSERHKQDILDASVDMMMQFDTDLRIIWVNKKASSVINKDVNDILGHKCHSIFRGKDTPCPGCPCIKSLQTGNPENQIMHYPAMGSVGDIYWDIYATPMRDNNDQIIGISETAHNITCRMNMEDSLRENEKRFHRIITETDAGYFFIDNDGHFLDVNNAWLKMHHYSSLDQVIGQHFSLTQVDTDIESTKKIVKELLEKKSGFTGEFSRRCKDGSVGYHTLSAHLVVQGEKVIGIEGFLIDTTSRKQAEEALQESEKKYRLIFETMTNGFALVELIYDDNGKVIDCRYAELNPAHEKLTGLEADTILGKTLKECIPDFSHALIEKYAGVDKTGNPLHFKTYVEGLKMWFRADAYRTQPGFVAVIFENITKQKQINEALRIAHDELEKRIEERTIELAKINEDLQVEIAERKQAEVAMRESEAKYKDLYDSAYDMFVSVDAKTAAIIECNQTLADVSGYAKEEIIGRPIFDMYTADSAEFAKKYVFPLFLKTGLIENAEMRLQRKDGSTIEVNLNVSAVYDDQGSILYSRSVWRDITRRKQTEEKLRRYSHNLNERVKELNCLYGVSKLLEKHNTSIEEILRQTVDLIPPAWQYSDIACCRIILDGKEYITNNFAETQWKQCSDIIVNGEPSGACEVYYLEEMPDIYEGPFIKEERNLINVISERLGRIAERKLLQKQLIRSERLAATGQLAASIAHEINSPLQGISSLLNLIERNYKQDKELLEDLNLVNSGFISIRDTVKKLLDLNRPGTERKQSMNINSVIEDTVSLLKSHLKKNKIKVILNLSSKTPDITASPQLLGQVFINLINNSVEAMTGTDKIQESRKTGESAARKSADREITICSNHKKGLIIIKVADTGVGVFKKDMEHIFDPFYTRKKKMGMGIGLSICNRIIKDHNGSIEIVDSPKRGAAFTITLPT